MYLFFVIQLDNDFLKTDFTLPFVFIQMNISQKPGIGL